MTFFLLGLLLFLGMHSVRLLAPAWREGVIARRGAGAWKGLYTLVSLLGFAALLWGYRSVRMEGPVLMVWQPPAAHLVGLRHGAALLVALAFILLAAAYVPGNGLKARLHHPMVLGVKTWALAHLLVNGSLHGVLLFGAFLVWAVLSFRAARQRDRAAGTAYPPGRLPATLLTVAVGLAAWALMAFWLHERWLGLRPFAALAA